MAEIYEQHDYVRTAGVAELHATDRAHQAFRLLHLAFIVAPTVAGLDKFFHLLANWDTYLSVPFARLSPFAVPTLMRGVGVVEIVAGFLVAVRPKLGAYVVAAWLALIILNLLLRGAYYDVALRDFGLFLGALALGRLADGFERPTRRRTEHTLGA
jgi:hypothetical protein